MPIIMHAKGIKRAYQEVQCNTGRTNKMVNSQLEMVGVIAEEALVKCCYNHNQKTDMY